MSKLGLFDIVKCLFEDPEKFSEISHREKEKNFFMINRFMAIKLPVQAQLLNKTKINGGAIVNFWHKTMRKNLNKTPGWIFTKSNKPQKSSKEKEGYSEQAKQFYLKYYQLGEKDFREIQKFDPKGLKKSLKTLDKKMETIK